MRLAIFLASLLVLSGCASAEPQEDDSTAGQVTEQSTTDTATQDEAEAIEPEPSETEEEESASQEPSESSDEESEEGPEESQEPAETQEPEQEESSQGENESAEANEEQSQEPEPTQEPSPSPTPEQTTVGYTLAQVAERDSAAECWVAVDGKVYDLTSWIRSHPGGSGAILNLCGKDGTSSFTSQHGGQARPTSTLDGYYIAPLVG
jgi:cytochrome b involved in lipid metabolism